MRVDRRRQTVVKVLRLADLATAKVHGLRHAPGGEDAQQLVEVGVVGEHCRVQGVREGLGRRHIQLHADGGRGGEELVELPLGGPRVATEAGKHGEGLGDAPGDGDVGEEHELLHQVVRLANRVRGHVQRVVGLGVELKPHLWRREGQRTGFNSSTPAHQPRPAVATA